MRLDVRSMSRRSNCFALIVFSLCLSGCVAESTNLRLCEYPLAARKQVVANARISVVNGQFVRMGKPLTDQQAVEYMQWCGDPDAATETNGSWLSKIGGGLEFALGVGPLTMLRPADGANNTMSVILAAPLLIVGIATFVSGIGSREKAARNFGGYLDYWNRACDGRETMGSP